jgi:hypothetical protein
MAVRSRCRTSARGRNQTVDPCNENRPRHDPRRSLIPLSQDGLYRYRSPLLSPLSHSLVHDRLNRERRVSFRPIVHQHIGLSFLADRLIY